jgi:hypothetical protein
MMRCRATVEEIPRRAIAMSPTQGAIWNQPIIMSAVRALATDQARPEMRALYQAIEKQILVDWYGAPQSWYEG